MYKDNLIVEGTCHTYHISEENALNPQAVGTGNGLFEIINNLHPDGYELPPEKWFKDDSVEDLAELMWLETDIDIARYMSTKLTDYFEDGMNRLDTGIELRERYGEFRIPSVLGSVNPLADDALEGADVIMVLRIQRERIGATAYPDGDAFHERWGLTDARLARLPEHARVLHPGPVNRGVEIADAVADGPASLIVEQVRFGVAARTAVFEWLIDA